MRYYGEVIVQYSRRLNLLLFVYLEFHASCVNLEPVCGIKQRCVENLTKIVRNNFGKTSIFE